MAKGLGKKFIDSVVGQIGRDAGRVVSNQVFGDAHAIKISSKSSSDPVSIGDKYFISHDITKYNGSYIEDEGFVEEKGFQHDSVMSVWILFFALITTIIPYVAPVMFTLTLVAMIYTLTTNKWGHYKYFNVPRYKIDGRFKEGFRQDGTIPYKLQISSIITPEVKRKMIYSIVYIIVLLIISIFITLKFRGS